jgi:hypothetical protein
VASGCVKAQVSGTAVSGVVLGVDVRHAAVSGRECQACGGVRSAVSGAWGLGGGVKRMVVSGAWVLGRYVRHGVEGAWVRHAAVSEAAVLDMVSSAWVSSTR